MLSDKFNLGRGEARRGREEEAIQASPETLPEQSCKESSDEL